MWQSISTRSARVERQLQTASRGKVGVQAPELVRLRNVARFYGSVTALDDVSLTIRRSGVHGLVGPNGSGKTTLLNAISGFVRPQAGSITVFGHPTAGKTVPEIARLGVGRTFQAPRIYDLLTIAENLQLGFDASARTDAHWSAAFAEANAGWLHSEAASLTHGHQPDRLYRALTCASFLLDEPRPPVPRRTRRAPADPQLCREGANDPHVEHDLNLYGVATHQRVEAADYRRRYAHDIRRIRTSSVSSPALTHERRRQLSRLGV